MKKPRHIPRRKRIVFAVVVAIAVAAVIEGISLVGLIMLERNELSFAKIHKDRVALARGEFPGFGVIGSIPKNVVVHPYLGWVLDPKVHPEHTLGGQTYRVNQFGFLDAPDRQFLRKRSERKLIVAIVGGSVAWAASALAANTLTEELQTSSRFRDKEIVIVRLAIPAYKQPQQLFALTYALILGAQFDIVINIDGYNEVALHAAENKFNNVFVAYPRGWNALVVKVNDPEIMETEHRVRRTDQKRKNWAAQFNGLPLRYSPTANFIWRYRDNKLKQSRRRDIQAIISHQSTTEPSYTAGGPRRTYKSDAEMYRDITRIWANSSSQLDQLCRANGIEYHHVLQPNQYLPGSKPLSEREERQAIYPDPDYEYGNAIEKGYPYLIAAGAKLRSRGLNFHDLTGLFSNTRETIYVDTCCHYNQLGNEMLMKSIAARIESTSPTRALQ